MRRFNKSSWPGAGSRVWEFRPTSRGESGEKGSWRTENVSEGRKKTTPLPGEENWRFFGARFMWLCFELLELDDILNGFWNGRRFQLQRFRELICDFDNERECALEQQGNGGHLPQDVGPEPA